jgi:hypothetical protein
MEKFWDKVNKCKHEETDKYLEFINCETPYCSGSEWHCKHCGVYISECGCGYNDGMSGWSHKRWNTYYKNKKKNGNSLPN